MSLTAGVDLGGTKIQTAVVRGSRSGWKVVGEARTLTPKSGAADVVATIAETVREAADSAGVRLTQIQGVGIGTPGTVNADTGEVSRAANIPGLETGFALGPSLSRAVGGRPVVVDNDVRVAMLGEYRAGAGRPYRNLLGVFVGTGVGGGLILEGRLRHGRGAAGEIGHTVVKDKGRRCSCGRRGCLEAYAGRASMEATARRLVKRGHRTVLFELMEKRGRDHLFSGIFAAALEQKDRMTVALIEEAAWALSIALASAQNLLDLEAIIVGGGLGDRLGQTFIDHVAAGMRPHLFVDDKPPAMLATELQDLSGAVGAAILAAGSAAPL